MDNPEIQKLQDVFKTLRDSNAPREKCLEAELALIKKQEDIAQTALVTAKLALREIRENTVSNYPSKVRSYAGEMLNSVLAIEKGTA